MCARITMTTTAAEIADLFNLDSDLSLPPRYNVAPSQPIPVVRIAANGQRELVLMRWGFVPHWNTDPKHAGFVNARAETAHELPTFRDAFRSRRCIVPADGFYEWERRGKQKQPYFFHRIGGGPIALAGLWDRWTSPNGSVDTVAVLTVPANDLVKPLHDRMPAILLPDRLAAWLDPRQSQADDLLPLLAPFSPELMESWPVADRVNSARVDEPDLTTAVVLPAHSPRVQPTLFDVG